MPSKKRQRIKIPGAPSGLGVTNAVNGRGDKYIRVRCGKRFTGGDVVVKNFKTEREARDFIFGTGPSTASELRAINSGVLHLKRAAGASAFQLTVAQINEAASAVRALGATSITDAVKYYLHHARPAAGVKLLSEVIDAHIAAMRERLGLNEEDEDSRYIRAQTWSCALLKDALEDPEITKIRDVDIEKIAKARAWKALNTRNYYRDWSMLFNYAVKHAYLIKSPMLAITRPRVKRTTPPIYTVQEAGRLLVTAARMVPDLVPYISVGLFAGVRLEEMKRMDWEMIEKDYISLRAEVTKTNEARDIPIEKVLRMWLDPCPDKRGPILPQEQIRYRLETLYNTAGFRKRNALRHSFASYHLAAYNSPEKTQLALGQQTPSVLFKSYRQVVRPEEAKPYWELTPDKVGKMFPI